MTSTEQGGSGGRRPSGFGLSREKIQQLLAAVGSRPDDEAQPEVTEYNWHQPHRFVGAERKKVEELAKRASRLMAKKLGALCHRDVRVRVESISEHFADELLDNTFSGEHNDYYLACGVSREEPAGFIWVPIKTALTWVTRLLGDSEAEADLGRGLSQLEETLLLDLAAIITEALSAVLAGCNLDPADTMACGHIPLELHGPEEFCKLTLKFTEADAADADAGTEACAVILCDQLESVVSKYGGAGAKFTGDAISNAILRQLEQSRVCVDAQLASVALTFEQIMNLGTGDVLMLDRRIEEPIEVVLDGQTVLRGMPAKTGGKYAVVIDGQNGKRGVGAAESAANT